MRDFLLSPFLIPIAGIICGSLIAIVAIVADHWRKARQTEIHASLVHEMLNRGMSAEEIELVLTSGRGKKARSAIGKTVSQA
jgi:hypothetical protein